MAKEEQLQLGVTVQLSDGSTAVIQEAPDLRSYTVRVRYVDAPFAKGKVGQEDDCSIDDITSWYQAGDLSHTEGRLG